MTMPSVMAAICAATVLVGCGSPPVAGPPTASGTQIVSVDGVQLSVPKSWPVIDGGHAKSGCGALFEGQADRVFVGKSVKGSGSCPFRPDAPPGVDGVWITTPDFQPTDWTPKTLPGGEEVQVHQDRRSPTLNVWTHGVLIWIGIGPNPVVGNAILDSINYRADAADTPIAAPCPTHPGPDVMPSPTLVTEPVALPLNAGTINPAPAGVQPKVAAFHLWHTLHQSFSAGGFPKDRIWHIYFGIRPDQPKLPVWVIVGEGAPSKYGACGSTTIGTFDANTGSGINMEVGG